jgi:spore maturation protein CgeB
VRVIFLYECRYRNDGPPLFLKTNFMWHKDKLGVEEVRHFIPEGDYRRWGKADLYVWPDAGEDALNSPPFECPRPNAYWCSDSHLGMDYRLQKAKEFDYVFVSIPRHIDRFREAVGHDRVYWLPHAGEPTCYQKIETVKKYDVCFIGHLPNAERIGLLDRLFREFPDFYYGQKFFEEANQKYCESKIIFNHCIDREANMRVFEGTLSGSLLLTSYSKDVEDLGYKDGEHLAFYKDSDEMIDKARYYVANDELREQIAKRGMQYTLNNHTYFHRAQQMLQTIKKEEPCLTAVGQ